MIVAEQKPFEELKATLAEYKKILIVGCGTCVAVCMAGGEKEVEILASMLKMGLTLDDKGSEIDIVTLQRQCDVEFYEPLDTKLKEKDYDVILSTACGAGVQFLAGKYDNKIVFPALNTRFIGVTEQPGIWGERCSACGNCILGETGGVCPITICAKGLVNGPCGGTNKGKCEVSNEKDCAWTLIYRRLEKLGKLDNIKEIFPPKKFSLQTKPAKVVHEAYQQLDKK